MGTCLEVSDLFDKGVIFYGENDEDVFTEAALWLCNTITDIKKVNNRITYHIEGGGFSKEEMLISFLNQILRTIREDSFIFMDFLTRFFEIRGSGVETWAYGEPFMPKHKMKKPKLLRIEQTDGRKFRSLIDPAKYEHYHASAEIAVFYEKE